MTPLERIAHFPHDLVVQAGAGTGKTHALVTLYLHLVGGLTAARRRVPPPRIAVVTFTDKAAGELQERIRTRLRALVKEPGALARLEPTLLAASQELGAPLPEPAVWSDALLALAAAPIGTYHAFAGTLLRRYAARAGIDPEYQLLDETEGAVLVSQAAERAVLDALSADEEGVLQLVAEYGYYGLGRGRGLVEILVELRARRAEEGRAALAMAENYDRERVLGEVQSARQAFISVARQLSTLAPALGEKSRPLAEELSVRLAKLDLDHDSEVNELVRAAGRLRGQALDGWPRQFKQAAERLSEARAGLRAAPLAAALARLVASADATYREQKRAGGKVDFADLLTTARDLLRDDLAIRTAVREQYDVLLVDEFQDTNPVQAELVESIGHPLPDQAARLFMVGDRKQAIYEFRGGDAAVFARVANDLLARGGGEELLTQSRRSTPAVLALCNALFARVLRGGGEGEPWRVDYVPERDDLAPVRESPDQETGGELLTVASGPSAEARVREARAIARRIGQLRAAGRPLKQIVILLRRFTHLGDYLEALRAARLPYFVVRGRGFFAAQEVRDLASALTVLDNPDDLVALVAVLRSPLVGLSDESLARLALAGQLRLRVLLDEATVLSPAVPAPERDAVLHFRRHFGALRRLADRLGPTACLEALIEAGDQVALLAAMVDGEQRVANLMRLVEQARAFEARGGELRGFIDWLRRAAAPGGEVRAAEAQVTDEGDDVLRVMTVHQAKGLEFDVVFVPSCGALDRRDGTPVLYDPAAGLGIKLRDEFQADKRVHTSASRRVEEVRRARQAAESRRLFYVAATRARDLVVFSGERGPGGQETWRAHLDALVGDPVTRPLLRVIDGDSLLEPAPREGQPLAAQSDEACLQERLRVATARATPQPAGITVAVTQLADFQLCPRRYQQFHLLGLSEHPSAMRASSSEPTLDSQESALPLDSLRRGTLAHRLLELTPFSSAGADRAALGRLLVQDGYDQRDQQVNEVLDHVAAFLDTDFARALEGVEVRRELPFLLAVPCEGCVLYLRGQIDLLVFAPDGVTVIDYKHARLGAPDEYRFQLEAYALAARQLYPQAPSIRLGLAFLKERDPSPGIIAAPPSEPFLAELSQLGRDLVEASTTDRWPDRPMATCQRLRCGFTYYCHASGA